MPAFRVGKPRVHLQLSDLVVVPPYGTTVFQWQVVDQEPDVWDPMAPTDVPVTHTGTWLLDCQVFLLFTDQTGPAALSVYVDGTDALVYKSVQPTLAAAIADSAARAVRLTAGQVITMQIDGNAGDIYVIPGVYTFLDLVRIGPERWT